MTTQRRSYETGHKPKCLVIVDDTAEWDRAVYYASRWAIRVGGGVVMLRIIEIEDQNQQWLGVADIMRAEAEEAANEALDRASGRANGIAAITPERVIREGDPTEQILDVIDKDVDITMLVLAANPGAEGPGPLVTLMAEAAGSFPIPVPRSVTPFARRRLLSSRRTPDPYAVPSLVNNRPAGPKTAEFTGILGPGLRRGDMHRGYFPLDRALSVAIC